VAESYVAFGLILLAAMTVIVGVTRALGCGSLAFEAVFGQ
jgi:hypothetical protein